MDLVAAGNAMEFFAFVNGLSEDDQTACFNAAPTGHITKLKNRVRELNNEANRVLGDYETQLTELGNAQDPAALELYDELTEIERGLVDKRLSDITHRQLQLLRKDAA